MASLLAGLIHDQILNVHSNGASAGGKSTVSKAPKKGGLSRRKPLGDLSNSVKPTSDQSLKKQSSNIFPDKEIAASISKMEVDGGKKKSSTRAPEKLQTSCRKALSDISNSGKPNLHEAPKKSLNSNLSVVAEEDISDICGEGFLHNHQECIKAQNKAMGINEILMTILLDRGYLKQSAPLQLRTLPASPPRYLEVEELPEEQPEDQSHWNYDHFIDFDSPPPCRCQKSPNRYLLEKDHAAANFMLVESP